MAYLRVRPYRHWSLQLLLVWVLTSSVFSVLGAEDLPAYPGADLVETQNSGDVIRNQIILSSLKKIRNVLEPDRAIIVQGRRRSRTYYVPDVLDIEDVIEHYRNSANQGNETLFTCQGRSCGSSNYWANTVFKNSILYGPEQFQYYWVGLNRQTHQYQLIYMGRRGTRKIYVHHEVIAATTQDPKLVDPELAEKNKQFGDKRIIRVSLAEFVPDLDAFAMLLLGTLQASANEKARVAIVVHDKQQGIETLQQAIDRTTRQAEGLKRQLMGKGVAEDRLEAYGVGPLSPVEDRRYPRVDLVLLPH